MTLSQGERERYSGQLALPGWGAGAQERLRGASAIVVGAGAVGSPAAAYLAAAGVGRIGIVDPAPLALSRLSRQPLHVTLEVGVNTAESLALKLGMLNAEVQVEPYPVALEALNAAPIVAGADVAVEASNDPGTRILMNDACCAEGIPLVVGLHRAWSGSVLSVRPGESACARCAGLDASLSEAAGAGEGALGAVAGAIGALSALEALKLVTGVGEPLLDRVLRLDGTASSTAIVGASRLEGCRGCAGAASPPQSR